MFNDTRCAEFADYSLPSVVEFECNEYVEDAEAFAAVMKAFPNLEVLNAPISNLPLHRIIECLPKLKTISAYYFKMEMMLGAKSSSLRELKIGNSESMTQCFLWLKTMVKTMVKD